MIPHPLVVDSMQRLAPIARERPGLIRFIHLNHTNPLLHDEVLVDRLAADGFGLARMGERVVL